MADIEARYEFRVWGENLSELRARLNRRATPVKSSSSETYLVSWKTDECNVKIRGDAIEIKLLIAEYRGLEQWKPVLKAAFPLDQSSVADVLLPALEIHPLQLSRSRYELNEFFNEVIRTQPDIAIAEVGKTRFRFSLGVCLAEFTLVLFKDARCQTVAIESADPDELLRLIHEIGLVGADNLSYVRYIKHSLRLGKS